LVSTLADLHSLEEGEAAFEDGTVNYLGLPAVGAGLAFMEAVGVELIQKRIMRLFAYLSAELRVLRHRNGRPLIRIYGPAESERRGAALAFNVLDRYGALIPHYEVEMRANEANISVRSGCFCNPGASEYALQYTGAEVLACYQEAGAENLDKDRYAKCMGRKATGAVRASLGMASNFSDVHRFMKFIIGTYLN